MLELTKKTTSIVKQAITVTGLKFCFPEKEGWDFSGKNIPRGLLMRGVWRVTSQTGLSFLEQFKHVEGKVSQKDVKLVA